jgi:chromosome segregation ATPase
MNRVECGTAAQMNRLSQICIVEQGLIDVQDSVTGIEAQLVAIEQQLTTVEQKIDQAVIDLTAAIASSEAAILGQLTVVNDNVTAQSLAIQAQVAAAEAQIVADIDEHDNNLAAHDANLTAAAQALTDQLAQHDQDIKDELAEASDLVVRVAVEKALLSKDRYAYAFLPEAQGGYLEAVRALVTSTIAAVQDAGESVNFAETRLASAEQEFANENWKRAFNFYALAYCEATKLPGESCPAD